MFVDCHCHLHFPQFDADREQVLHACEQQKITVVNTGTDAAGNEACVRLQQEFPFVKIALGIHPVDIVSLGEEEFDAIIDSIEQYGSRTIAIGEVGLDFHHIVDERQKDMQQERLRFIVQELRHLQKPFVVHSRNAEKEVIQLLEQEQCKKVVLHCFTGNFKLAKRAEELGWMLSIPTIIVRSMQFQGLVQQTALEHLLTETDAPFLAPPPKQRSDPTLVKAAVEKIAEVKGVAVADAQRTVFRNFQRYFGSS